MDDHVENGGTSPIVEPWRKRKLHADLSEARQIAIQKRVEEKRLKEKIELEEKRAAALNQMRYLLSICDEYSDVYKKQINHSKVKVRALKNGEIKPKEVLKDRNAYALKSEDVEKVSKEVKSNGLAQTADVSKRLKYFEGGTLHPYQIDGVNWMYNLFLHSSNGILADEMGLGKTVQVIALICTLLEQNVPGPYMILAPLSTIPNWKSEFERFAPRVPTVVIVGSRDSRNANLRLIRNMHKIENVETHPVVIMSYEVPGYVMPELRKYKWRYIIVDEGQIIKNPDAHLGIRLRQLKSDNRLILTGTPLQNNLIELWTLLNFILPNFFVNMNTFSELIHMGDLENKETLIQEEQSNHLVTKMHNILHPFMLRRLKKDVLPDLVPKKEMTVYCPITDLQRKLYNYIMESKIEELRGCPDKEDIDVNAPRPKRKCSNKAVIYKDYDDSMEDGWLFVDNVRDSKKSRQAKRSIAKAVIDNLKMASPFTMLQKVLNHPYLVHFPLDMSSEKKQLLINEDLVKTSGKFLVLDTLLPALKVRGHKILLFSQTVILLDLLEDYLIFRKHNYRRLDGSCSIENRIQSISDFNHDPDVFIFLITTRAGGVGLNLMAADTVIFYDRDWNPQQDIQAQARCHRIGQNKPVVTYTLTMKNTIEDHIFNIASRKLVLERVILPDKKFKGFKKSEIVPMIETLQELKKALDKPSSTISYIFSDKLEFARLLDRSDLYKQMSDMEKKTKKLKTIV